MGIRQYAASKVVPRSCNQVPPDNARQTPALVTTFLYSFTVSKHFFSFCLTDFMKNQKLAELPAKRQEAALPLRTPSGIEQ